jgi:hypothetical protein
MGVAMKANSSIIVHEAPSGYFGTEIKKGAGKA